MPFLLSGVQPVLVTIQPIDVQIREATRRDLTSVLALYSQPALDNGVVLSMEHAEHIFEQMLTYPNYRLYISVYGSLIIGTFTLLIMDNLIHDGRPSGIVEAVAVDPEFQNQGIGKCMMQFAMDRCREFGCYKLMLSANLSRDRAHEFYQSLGFQQHGYSFITDLVSSPTPSNTVVVEFNDDN
ncbi:MAG: GNAT family N-acetyltransferase [Cyanobacteria bacterium J06627_8]